jgi:hypothetical protein
LPAEEIHLSLRVDLRSPKSWLGMRRTILCKYIVALRELLRFP